MKRTSILILLLITWVGCNDQVEERAGHSMLEKCQNAELKNNMLVKMREINMDVSGLQYNHHFNATYYDSTRDWYIGMDAGSNKLDIFDLDSGSYLRSIYFYSQGPDPFTISDFYFLNPDSVYVLDENRMKLRMVNIKGERIVQYELVTDDIEEHLDSIAYIESSKDNRLHIDGQTGRAFLPGVPAARLDDPDLFRYPFILIFDMQGSRYVGSIGRYPPGRYATQQYSPFSKNYWRIIQARDSLVYYMFNHAPYIVELDYLTNETLHLYCAKSQYVPYFLPDYEGEMFDYLSEVEYFATTPGYFLPFYHRALERYFVPVKHGQPPFDKEGLKSTPHTSDFSILSLDKDFQPIGEQQFSAGLADFFGILPCRDGLLILQENPGHPDNEENILSFEIYEVH